MPLWFFIAGTNLNLEKNRTGAYSYFISKILALYAYYIVFCFIGKVFLIPLDLYAGAHLNLSSFYTYIISVLYGSGTLDKYTVQPVTQWYFTAQISGLVLLYLAYRTKAWLRPFGVAIIFIRGMQLTTTQYWPYS